MRYTHSIRKLIMVCKKNSIRVVPEIDMAYPLADVAYDSSTNSLFINKSAKASDIAATLKHLESHLN